MPDALFLAVIIILLLAILGLVYYIFSTRSKAKTIAGDFKSIFESIWRIEKAVLETVVFDVATSRVVNIILSELGYINYGYEVIVLTLLDENIGGLRRIAISNTEAAGRFLLATPIPFENIVIPFTATDNLSIRAINEHKMFVTKEVSDVLYPAIDREWVENFQKTLGIKTSIVYPIVAKDKMLGTLIFSLSKEQQKISEDEWAILDSFVGAAGIALDNALLFQSLTDITEKLRVANERLKEIDKLKDEFVSLASHELRTPMTAIKSFVWLLLNNNMGPLSDRQKEYLQRTYDSTERLINLVNDMLNISRIESGRLTIEPVPTDMAKLVADVVVEVQARAQEVGVNIEYHSPATAVSAKADPSRIKEVLINLIGNSIKFTPEGGTITVSVEDGPDGYMFCKVKDTGRGISAEDLSKLFQKFIMVGNTHLTKERGQGTGLGLYISKSLVELHGGKIWAESEGEGKGATFAFQLPKENVSTAVSGDVQNSDSGEKTNTEQLPSPSLQA